jgi:hypothetical protein
VLEYRLYEDGWIKEHWIEINQKRVNIPTNTINTDTLEFEFIEFNETYNKYFNYFLATTETKKNTTVHVSESQNFTLKSLNALNFIDTINLWNNKNENKKVQYPKIKLAVYPLSTNEKSAIENITKKYTLTQKTLKDFLNNPNIDFYQHISEEITKTKVIYEEYLNIIQNFSNVHQLIQEPSLKYFHRPIFIANYLPKTNYKQSLNYEFNDTIKKLNYNFSYLQNFYQNDIISLNNYILAIHDSVIGLQKNIQTILKKLESESKLSDKEKQLLHFKDSVNYLFSSNNKLISYNNFHHMFEENINKFVAVIIKKYTAYSLDEKINYLDEQLNCMQDVFNFYQTLSKLPTKLQRLNELYTRVVFNPYTFTDMEERVKERVYNYFEQVIFPQIITDLNTITCNNLYLKVENIDKLYRQMVVLRDRDTKDLEKMIRKNENTNRILEMFNVNLSVF